MVGAGQLPAHIRARARRLCPPTGVACAQNRRALSTAARTAISDRSTSRRSVLGYWVGVRRLLHLAVFRAASRMVLPKILVLTPSHLPTQNRLKELPAGLAELKGLRVFDCSYNEISSLPGAVLSELTELRSLSASHNRMTSFGVRGLAPLVPPPMATLSPPVPLHALQDESPNHHARRMLVIRSPLSGFLALWSSHCRAKNRPHGHDSADPDYHNLLFSVARGGSRLRVSVRDLFVFSHT